MSDLSDCFEELDDPRAENSVYALGDLLVLMVAASMCGASSASEFSLFAETHMDLLNGLVAYKRAPSHDTFSRLLRILDPVAFAGVFSIFAKAFAKALREDGIVPVDHVVAIDGKSMRRAYEKGLSHCPPMTVSAFAAEAKLCLAISSTSKDNEIEAAIRVVELLDLTGKIITADALHCHHRMAEAITKQKGDYVIALKGNRHKWLAQAEQQFKGKTRKSSYKSSLEKSHDRAEWRKAEVVTARTACMKNHVSFIRVTTGRDQAEPHVRHYMASKLLSPQQALSIVRSHWQIENNLHWMLDVNLFEDSVRARKDNAPANHAALKRIARNILQTADTEKVPISHRIKKCGWNKSYLINALSHMR